MSDSVGGFGGMGKPGVRVSERGGGKANEFDLPLMHAGVIAGIILAGFLVVLPLEMLLIGRGLLLAAFVMALVYTVWRLGNLSESLLYRAVVVLLGGVALWFWLEYGQGYIEKAWIPVWYGMLTPDGYLPVQFGNDPLNMRLMPGWLLLVRALAAPGILVAYVFTGRLVMQRFGMEIVLPQFLAVVPNPVPVRVHVPGWFTHLEQDEHEPPEPARKLPPIIVESIDNEPHEREVVRGVTTSNGTGNSGRRTELPDLSPEQWDALADYVLAGRPWSGPEVGAGRILTTPQYRALTKALLRCEYLRERQPGNPRGGYDWTEGGLRFLRKRWWQRVE